jgi:hypothetical protein
VKSNTLERERERERVQCLDRSRYNEQSICDTRAVESESESWSRKELLGGVGVGKNAPAPTSV